MPSGSTTYTWDSLVSNDTVTIPQGGIVDGLPSSSSADYGTVNSLTINTTGELEGPGSVTAQNLVLNGGDLTLSDASLTIDQSTFPAGTITIADGGSFTALNAYQASGTTITFGATSSTVSNSLYIQPYIASGLTITNVAPGDNIYFDGGYTISGITLVNGATGVVYVEDSNGNKLATLDTAKKSDGTYYSASDFGTQTVSSGDYEIVCFLGGTMIRTPRGDVAIEDISVGDEVLAHDWKNGVDVATAVVWAGTARATVRASLPDDEAGYPVRILKDAVSAGTPCQDLLVTPEHCLFFNGKLTPVRMLVNGSSIFYDKTITSYDYYHVETQDHVVLHANGVLAESYLDTGNRGSFKPSGPLIRLSSYRQAPVKALAAPLAVDRDTVEPLHQSLALRAAEIGAEAANASVALTEDADLHLVTEAGRVIRKIRDSAGYAVFMIPENVEQVRIVSRSSRPSDTIGPFVDDRRQLGVLVSDIVLVDVDGSRNIDTYLTADLAGWNVLGNDAGRWTNGNAVLPLGERAAHAIAMLNVKIQAAGPYLAVSDSEEAAAQAV